MIKRQITEIDGKNVDVIEMKMPAKTDYIAVVRLCIAGICSRIGFSIDDTEDIKIAISEAYINAIKHGYENKIDSKNIVIIRFLIYPDKLVAVIKDKGEGFDTLLVDEYLKQKDKRRPNYIGMGIYVMKTLMDCVEYESTPEGTQVKMIKRLVR